MLGTSSRLGRLSAGVETSRPDRPGAAVAEALQLPTGEMYASASVRGEAPELHPAVAAILDRIPTELRGVGHWKCGLAVCVTNALNDGLDPTGSRAAAVIVRGT